MSLAEKLRMKEFRQEKNGDKNVTMIHGENGSGKTTILNAFSWCFYNAVDFENPENIINERLIDEAEIGEEVIVRVRITFENW